MLILSPFPIGAGSACIRRFNSTFTYLIYIRDVLDGNELGWSRRKSTTEKRLKTPRIFIVLSPFSFLLPKHHQQQINTIIGGGRM